ncbi:PAS domain-containing protein [Hyphococcus flavus]|uniref:histidine kinase n=1 Tax=Hyphococcus flavus TaxID=1866326 RepID=A0AAE9ZCU8_9PROT|nr:PAS domain-containing protein [Hyphococcus flavus]WDI32529.1 PAS domain-containing protein [Hyphococcus flavus]
MSQSLLKTRPGFATSAANASIEKISLELAHLPDSEFLTAYALSVSEALTADYFLIGRLNPSSNLVRSIRLAANGQLTENVTYSLDGTPCAKAVEGGSCVYPDGIADKFPRDVMLRTMNAQGYAGTALHGEDGQIIGIAVVLTTRPIANESEIISVLEHFSTRTAAAIETAEHLDRYRFAANDALDGIWEWDVLTGGAVLSDSMQALLGDGARRQYDFSKVENAIHPDDRPKHTQALRNHLSDNQPYDLMLRLRGQDGGYRWYRSRGTALRNEAGKTVRMIGGFMEVTDPISAPSLSND